MKRTEIVTAARSARHQTAVIEYHEILGGPEWWAMLPDGSVHVLDTATAARLSGAFRGAADRALPAVVQISVTTRAERARTNTRSTRFVCLQKAC